jgi:hypothetical protein
VATAGRSVAAEEWLAEFDSGFARIAGRLGRVEPRRQARAYLFGLLSDVDTRTCWQLAEQAGDASPHRMQRLLREAVWDGDRVRDDVRGLPRNDPPAQPDRGHHGRLGRGLVQGDTRCATAAREAARTMTTAVLRCCTRPIRRGGRGWTPDLLGGAEGI